MLFFKENVYYFVCDKGGPSLPNDDHEIEHIGG